MSAPEIWVRYSAASFTEHGCWPMCRGCKLKFDRERAKVTPEVRAALLDRDGSECRLCGVETIVDHPDPAVRRTTDHVFPVSRGGTSEMENLQILCQSCNSRKGPRLEPRSAT